MVALDTNILVRLLVKDDEQQLTKISGLFSQLEQNNDNAFVPLLVILEVNWVLSAFYEVARAEIIENLLMLLSTPILQVERHNELKKLLINARDNNYDLSDLLIAMRCEIEQALPVMTFDKRASKYTSFERLK